MQFIKFLFPLFIKTIHYNELSPFTPIDVAWMASLYSDWCRFNCGFHYCYTRYIRLFKFLLHNHKTPLRLTIFDHDDASMPLWTIYAVTVLIFHSGIQWLGVPVIQIHSCYIELESVSSLFIKSVVTRPA